VGGPPELSADLLCQLDGDPLRAADVAEPIAVPVALNLANKLHAAGLQATTAASMSSTANATWRMPGVFGNELLSSIGSSLGTRAYAGPLSETAVPTWWGSANSVAPPGS
jgi:hypothetical protein